MKKLLTLLLFLIASNASAQVNTLLHGDLEHGGYGGSVLKVGQINGETKYFVGGQGGWIINKTFVLGGGGYGLVSDQDVLLGNAGGSDQINMGYGGFLFEYLIRSDQLLHFTITTLTGAGGIDNNVYDDSFNFQGGSSDKFFVFEGGVNAMLNITEFLRIGAGVTYRTFSGIEKFGYTDSDFDGVTGMLTVKFGKF